MKKTTSKRSPTKKGNEFENLQLAQAMETYRAQLSLLVSIITVLVVANATVVGYAISTQIASIIFIGPLFPIGVLVVTRIIFALSLPVIYTAINIESKHESAVEVDWLASTFISVVVAPDYYDRLVKICSIGNRDKRIEELRRMPVPSFKGNGGRFVKIVLFIVIIGQIILPIVLSAYFGWRLL